MATTANTYTGDNSTVDFSFTFPYLKTTDIKVSLDKVVQTLTTHYTLHNATTIRFGSAPGTGVAIKIYRDTDSSQLSSTFYPGSAIRSGDLNDNFTQNLYATQEAENDVADAIRLSEANVFTATQTYDNDQEIRFNEDDDNGSAYVGLKGATDKGTSDSYTISLPAAPPAVNQILRAGGITADELIWADEAINSTHVTSTDNESTNENNLITFVEDATTNTGNVGLEMDGDFHYNPSTGTVTATVFKGNIDAVDGDFDGTLEADAYTVNGATLQTYIGTVSSDAGLHVRVTDNESTNENNLITFVEDANTNTGNVGLEFDGNFHYNPSTGTVTATTFSGAVSGTATDATHVTVTDNESTNENNLITFVEDANSNTGSVGLEFDGDFHYNPSTGTVTAANFKGDVDANNISVDGLLEADAITVNGATLQTYIGGVSTDSAITATNSTNSTHVTVTDNESTNENNLITFVEDANSNTGNVGLEFDGNFTYNPSSGNVTATTFTGNLVGDVDANNGDFDGTLEADAITVNGATLQTYIGGVSTDSAVSSTNSSHVLVTDNESTNENNLITFVENASTNTGNVGLEFDGNFHYNPSTGTVTATNFAGNVTGSIDDATNASHVLVTDNESTDEENLITFVEDANSNTGNVGLEFDGTFTYNPSSGTVTATVFKGDIDANDGDFDGTLEADAYTVNGATLQTYIGGVSTDSAITATNATHISVADNENTNENNLITFIENASATGNVGLESDGDLHYNPSTGTVTATVFKGRVPNIPENSQGSYTLVATDAGKFINSTGTVTVPNSVFSTGDMVTIYNNSTGDRTITQGTGVTMYLGDGDGDSGSVTLGQRCVATILFISASVCVITGGDVT